MIGTGIALCLAVLAGWAAMDLSMRWRAHHAAAPALSGEEAALAERLVATVDELAARGERRTRQAQLETADLLRSRLESLGYRPWVQEYTYEDETWPNVVVSTSPLDSGREFLVVMAHFDSIAWNRPLSAPGADDDGSGVAVLLELARAYAGTEPDVPIAFCFFSNEEVGRRGSRAFVAWAREQGVAIRAAVNVDVVGYARPRQLVDIRAVLAQRAPRAAYGLVSKQIENARLGFAHGQRAILVAGKTEHRALVGAVSDAMKTLPGLDVIPRARDDCG